MYSQTWIMSIVALLVMDVRTGALEQGEPRWTDAGNRWMREAQDLNRGEHWGRPMPSSGRLSADEEEKFKNIVPRRCYQCSPKNGTACELSQGWLTATCPSARPYCATVASAPDFATSLGCATADAPCSLTTSPRQTLELTCICPGQLCNAPFSTKLRNELLNFSYTNANESAFTEAFFKLSNFANVSESALYKEITVDANVMLERNSSDIISSFASISELTRRGETPRAEALKQQATVPSDDDEDESEGSGAYEDSRSHIQSHPASAPAAPSSYLPAEENKAINHISNLLLPPLLFFCTFI